MPQTQQRPATDKRLGAGSYLLLMSIAVTAWSLATAFVCLELAVKHRIGLAELNTAVSFLGTGVGFLFYGATTRRLRDLNFPGWCVKVFAFPLFGVIFLPVLCFLSGPRWANDFGPAPQPSGFFKVAAALSTFFVAVFVSQWAVTVYYATRVVLHHRGV